MTKITTVAAMLILLAASFHLAPGSAGVAGARAHAIHTARSSR